ncbi:MAG: PEGA domain-containing protein [Planctomycetota bacterium]
MKITACVLFCLIYISGCIYHGPAVSKSTTGNLEVNVLGKDVVYNNAELYIDGNFIGNITKNLPVLHIRRGQREIRIEAPGLKPYEKHIIILGRPNHQVINAFMEKE